MPVAKEAQHEEKLDVRAAVAAARQFASNLFPPAYYQISLEEIEKSEDGKFWLVTLGFEPVKSGVNKTLADILNPPKERFKVFKVNTRTGTVVSMKMRPME
jgi:hypothetical protein